MKRWLVNLSRDGIRAILYVTAPDAGEATRLARAQLVDGEKWALRTAPQEVEMPQAKGR